MGNEINENEVQKKDRNSFTIKFILVFLFTCLAAAGLFLLWTWLAYQKRYSTELIRAGLVLLYILPCLLGGKMLRTFVKGNTWLFGAILGACYFAAVLVLSVVVKGSGIQINQLRMAPFLLCVISGITGTLRLHRKKEQVKE